MAEAVAKTKEAEKQQKKVEKEGLAAAKAVEKKERTASAHAEKKFQKCAEELQRALCSPGCNLVPAGLKANVEAASDEIRELTISCGSHALGVGGAICAPADMNQKIEYAKKCAAVFGMQCKAFLEQSRLSNAAA